jgi:hypothetical protein
VALAERERHQGRHPQGHRLDGRSGLGGLQNFDAEMMTPQLVAKRLPYMSPEWADAFQYSPRAGRGEGLEFGIAASPGLERDRRSVGAAEDGMKKLVWSETLVEGGKPVR